MTIQFGVLKYNIIVFKQNIGGNYVVKAKGQNVKYLPYNTHMIAQVIRVRGS